MAWLQKLERKSGVRWRVYWRDPAGLTTRSSSVDGTPMRMAA